VQHWVQGQQLLLLFEFTAGHTGSARTDVCMLSCACCLLSSSINNIPSKRTSLLPCMWMTVGQCMLCAGQPLVLAATCCVSWTVAVISQEVYDARALRVVVDDGGGKRLADAVQCCYRLVAAVHKLWHPIHGEFDDYIANPKSSGYQALHTAVWGPGGAALEVQIKTSGGGSVWAHQVEGDG